MPGRRALSIATAVALTFGGVAAIAPATASAAPGGPLLGTCLQIDDNSTAVKLGDSNLTNGLTDLFGGIINGLAPGARSLFDGLGLGIDDIIRQLTGATIEFTDPKTGTQFQVIDVNLKNGTIDAADTARVNLPDGVTDFTYRIVPNDLTGPLGPILNPLLGTSGGVTGSASCGDTLPLQGITGSYFALNPARVLDTRRGGGGTGVKVPALGTISVKVTGAHGVPASGVGAVGINVTATLASSSGFITVFPTGSTRRDVSNLNYAVNTDVANSAIATVGDGGMVSFYNGSPGTVDLIVDVNGYYVSSALPQLPLLPGAYQPVTSTRLLDTRVSGQSAVPDQGTRTIQVTGRNGVPAGASSVVLNLTATNTQTTGYLSAYPAGVKRPFVSNLNFTAKTEVADQVVIPVGKNGSITVFHQSVKSTATTDVIVDIAGYFTGGVLPAQTSGLQRGLEPVRLLDTRIGLGATQARIPGRGTITLQLAGRGGIPKSFVRSVLLTVTATNELASGFLTVYPGGSARPDASVLNFRGRNIANQVNATLGADGTIKIYNGATKGADVVVDVTGYVVGTTLTVG